MRFIYSEWNSRLAEQLRGQKDLMAIFNHILLQVKSRVEQTALTHEH